MKTHKIKDRKLLKELQGYVDRLTQRTGRKWRIVEGPYVVTGWSSRRGSSGGWPRALIAGPRLGEQRRVWMYLRWQWDGERSRTPHRRGK